MTRFALSFGVCASLLALGGCDNPPVEPDAPIPMSDTPAIVPSFLFGACTLDEECAAIGEGAFCLGADEGPAGGYCTLPCTDRTPCDLRGSYHHCLPVEGRTGTYCVSRCRNGIDCGRTGWTCDPEASPTGDGVCLSVCASDEECGGGNVCNRESGDCQAPPLNATGGANGAPCTAPGDCQSEACVLEGTRTAPSGWVGGMCLGPCRIADGFNTTNFHRDDTLPPGTCVDGAVCIPGNGYSAGDLGSCYHECVMDAECREGYGCLRTIAGHAFTNGICVPRDCRGGTCPGGYTCVTVTLSDGSQTGRCAP